VVKVLCYKSVGRWFDPMQIWDNLMQAPTSEADKAEWYKVVHQRKTTPHKDYIDSIVW